MKNNLFSSQENKEIFFWNKKGRHLEIDVRVLSCFKELWEIGLIGIRERLMLKACEIAVNSGSVFKASCGGAINLWNVNACQYGAEQLSVRNDLLIMRISYLSDKPVQAERLLPQSHR